MSEGTGNLLNSWQPLRAGLRPDDSGRLMICVEYGKGGKEPCVMLAAQLPAILRTYWRLARSHHWQFPGRDLTRPIEPTTLHAACRSARAAANEEEGPCLCCGKPRHAHAGERSRRPSPTLSYRPLRSPHWHQALLWRQRTGNFHLDRACPWPQNSLVRANERCMIRT